jgi:cyclopropane fatty-acyl-phospholipid synthase-like methyltransferase
MQQKPFAESCVENREPIFAALEPRLASSRSLLEIGSGTGQHAVYFAPRLAHLTWQTSDQSDQHPGIRAWLDEAALDNVVAPLALDVLKDPWPAGPFDASFSANTAHIMSEEAVKAMFRGVSRVLIAGGPFLLYGPFMYDGQHTAPSNAEFDRWLRHRDPEMGVRDVDWLKDIAQAIGLSLDEDLEMPVNNRILVWRKVGRTRYR